LGGKHFGDKTISKFRVLEEPKREDMQDTFPQSASEVWEASNAYKNREEEDAETLPPPRL
jgi:hypothetical protein